jgi:hypothetical protein
MSKEFLSIISNETTLYTIQRKNPHTGFTETTTYTGSLKDKPKGWKVVKRETFAALLVNGVAGKY